VILEVEARSIRSAEVRATQTMIERTRDRFELIPEPLAAFEPHIPVIDKSERRDG
jgi:hypothetical protein